MAKLTLSPITDNDHAVTMNANLDLIEAAIENTLSRDGTSPNQMNDDFDLNSNLIINMPPGTLATHPLQKQQIEALITASQVGVSITLNSLTDVVVPSPTVNQVLTFDGANWINANSTAIPSPTLIDTILRSDGAGFVEGPSRIRMSSAGVITLRDAIGNDTMALSHPGTDALIAFANTTDLDITGLSGRIKQGAETLAFLSEVTTPDPLLLNDGSALAPSYSFSSDPNTGMFNLVPNIIGFSTGGTVRIVIDTFRITGNVGNSGALVLRMLSYHHPLLIRF